MRNPRHPVAIPFGILAACALIVAAVANASSETVIYQYDSAGRLTAILNISSDVNHCGNRTTPCDPGPANGFATCVNGQCSFACNAGYTACANRCDLPSSYGSDPKNCGSCGNACPVPPNATAATCTNSQCGFTCGSGFTACGLACDPPSAFSSDVNNCGSCGNRCVAPTNGSTTCSNSLCQYACNTGYSLCGTSCFNESSDVNNCGSCGNRCLAPANGSTACSNSLCQYACNTGYTLCGTSCFNTSADVNNCGSCGHVCTPGYSCNSGTCTPPPPPPCGAATCSTGCCDAGGACRVPGNTNAICGGPVPGSGAPGGQACVACDLSASEHCAQNAPRTYYACVGP